MLVSGSWQGIFAWVIIAVAILYILSPIDIIPDVIPVLGWSDDVALGVFAFALLRWLAN